MVICVECHGIEGCVCFVNNGMNATKQGMSACQLKRGVKGEIHFQVSCQIRQKFSDKTMHEWNSNKIERFCVVNISVPDGPTDKKITCEDTSV